MVLQLKLIIVFLAIVILPFKTVAQNSESNSPISKVVDVKSAEAIPDTVDESDVKKVVDFKSDEEMIKIEKVGYFTMWIMGALTILLGLITLWRNQPLNLMWMRLYIIVLIICTATFLMAAGWNSQQTAPVYGILGMVLGYLFGQNAEPTSKQKAPDQNQESPASK